MSNSETGIIPGMGTGLKPGINPPQRVPSPTVKREYTQQEPGLNPGKSINLRE